MGRDGRLVVALGGERLPDSYLATENDERSIIARQRERWRDTNAHVVGEIECLGELNPGGLPALDAPRPACSTKLVETRDASHPWKIFESAVYLIRDREIDLDSEFIEIRWFAVLRVSSCLLEQPRGSLIARRRGQQHDDQSPMSRYRLGNLALDRLGCRAANEPENECRASDLFQIGPIQVLGACRRVLKRPRMQKPNTVENLDHAVASRLQLLNHHARHECRQWRFSRPYRERRGAPLAESEPPHDTT
ncbi:MAG: hypothetical protein ACLP01_25155 [Solirubrobacteraceae bacterium]